MLEGLADAGGSVPALEARPDIFGLEWIWQAFHALSTCRSYGMSVGPIPWTAMQTYAEAEDMNPQERRMMIYCIQGMDREYLEWGNRKTKTQQAPKKKR